MRKVFPFGRDLFSYTKGITMDIKKEENQLSLLDYKNVFELPKPKKKG